MSYLLWFMPVRGKKVEVLSEVKQIVFQDNISKKRKRYKTIY